MLVVPFICSALTTQLVSCSRECYGCLVGLDLADLADIGDILENNVLILSNPYWNLVTGRVQWGRNRRMAIHIKFGGVLSGPTDQREIQVNLMFASAPALRIDMYPGP